MGKVENKEACSIGRLRLLDLPRGDLVLGDVGGRAVPPAVLVEPHHGAKNTFRLSLRHFHAEMIILPRRAPDKHRKRAEGKWRFSQFGCVRAFRYGCTSLRAISTAQPVSYLYSTASQLLVQHSQSAICTAQPASYLYSSTLVLLRIRSSYKLVLLIVTTHVHPLDDAVIATGLTLLKTGRPLSSSSGTWLASSSRLGVAATRQCSSTRRSYSRPPT